MTQGRMIGAALGFVFLTIALVALLYQGGEPEPVEPAVIPDVEVPAPVPAAPTPAPAPVRPKPAPPPAPAPEPEPERDRGATVPEDARMQYNYAVDDAIEEAKALCLQPWANREAEGPVTLVMDAVVVDGELSEIALRGIQEVPGDVINCARDAAWNVDWPTFESEGELRFQRSFTAAPEQP